jgi:hypothetical protein
MAQMNTQYLAIMQLNSVELLARRHELTHEGRLIRKEIRRREATGFWKGEFVTNRGTAERAQEIESKVGTVTTYVKGAKR